LGSRSIPKVVITLTAGGPRESWSPGRRRGDYEYSVVIPVYNEQETLHTLFERVTAVLESLDGTSEVILVDDGSTDGSSSQMLEMALRDSRFKVIQLSRNFGHQIAITAGLDFASGNAVIVMDADLQDPPETILAMVRKWREGFDVVYAVRVSRAGENRFKRFTAARFYRLLRRLSDVEIPADVGDFRLVDRKALEAYKRMREADRYVRGMFGWVGFNQIGIPYQRDERFAGKTKFPLRKMANFALDALVSFSNAPLRLALGLGFVVSVASFLYGITAIVLKVSGAFTVSGWASVIFVSSFLGGVQLMVLGVVGEYVGRAYVETKRRPLYIVSHSTGLARLVEPAERVVFWQPEGSQNPDELRPTEPLEREP
jgi:glycosyltransferase involved in cell wall biosynthesis